MYEKYRRILHPTVNRSYLGALELGWHFTFDRTYFCNVGFWVIHITFLMRKTAKTLYLHILHAHVPTEHLWGRLHTGCFRAIKDK